MPDSANVAATLGLIRARAPLVHNITNFVVTNLTANALLAVGASPAMVEGADEVADFAARADALVLNLGTLSPPRAAVAAGAIPTRAALGEDLLALRPAVVRGNASEIGALAGVPTGAGRGVDSTAAPEAALEAARLLARRTGTVVAVTGAVDYITDGTRIVALRNGHPMMTRVTGMGCTATALIGACLAVQRDPLAAAVHGLTMLGVASELAMPRASGPGSLQVELLDRLYALEPTQLARLARITIMA